MWVWHGEAVEVDGCAERRWSYGGEVNKGVCGCKEQGHTYESE